jgi:hypothetical protein
MQNIFCALAGLLQNVCFLCIWKIQEAANMAHNVNIGLIYWKIKVKIVFPRNQTFD